MNAAPACSAARDRTIAAVRAAQLGEREARVLRQFESCWGGWSIALDVVCDAGTASDPTLIGRWLVSYAALDGALATYRRPGATPLARCGRAGETGNIAASHVGALVEIEPPVLFDYDGDGAPEIWIADRQSRELLSARNRVVSRYAPALKLRGVPLWGIHGVRDVDHDRRPDLLLTFDRAAPPSVPKRVAHSLPDGTFSETDDVARRELLAQCSAGTELPVQKPDGTIDVDASIAAVTCAALRGELGRDVSSRLAIACANRDDCHEVERWANDMYLYGVGRP